MDVLLGFVGSLWVAGFSFEEAVSIVLLEDLKAQWFEDVEADALFDPK